jgi:hypothetical protein
MQVKGMIRIKDQMPIGTKKKKIRHTVAFDSQQCINCPNQNTCPVKQGKKHHYLGYTDKKMRLCN